MGILILRSSSAPPAPQVFPLEVSSNGRYLQQADGTPFLITGDAPWMIVNQLDEAGIDAYLDAIEAAGINGIMFEAPGVYFTSQTPTYDNVDGDQPFATMTSASNVNFGSTPVAAYWARVTYLVNECLARGIVCLIQPAYLGFLGGQEGWSAALRNDTEAHIRTFGQFLAATFTQANIIWIAGGDYNGSNGSYDAQKVIFEEIAAALPNALITAHNSPDNAAFPTWGAESWFNLNTLYCYPDIGDVYPYEQAAEEYARDPPIPLFYLEGRYSQETGYTDAIGRLQIWTPFLSGAKCGGLIGENPRWHFQSPNAIYSYTGTYQDTYNSALVQAVTHFRNCVTSYQWQLLEPKTDTSLVSSSLSSGLSRITPALASDGTFALIYVPSSQTVTVVTNALSGVAGNVTIELYNPTNGQTTVNQASVAKSAGQNVATGGERVIVVKAA